MLGSLKAPSSCTPALTCGSTGLASWKKPPQEKLVGTRINANAATAKYRLPIRFERNVGVNFSMEKKSEKNLQSKPSSPVPLVLAAGRLTATLLVACIAACSRTSCWVTGCGRRRWRPWRLNAKGSEDTIEAIFGPPETRNHTKSANLHTKRKTFKPVPLYTTSCWPKMMQIYGPNGYGRSFGCFTLQQPVHNTLRIQYEQHPYLACCQATRKFVVEHLPSSSWKPGI